MEIMDKVNPSMLIKFSWGVVSSDAVFTGNNFLQDCSGKKEIEPQWNNVFKLASKLNFKGQGIEIHCHGPSSHPKSTFAP